MKSIILSTLVLVYGLSLSVSVNAADKNDSLKTVMEWMTLVIAPNSDILWNVDEPGTAADWMALEAAALAIIEASKAIEQNALNPQEGLWSSEAAWQELNAQMKQAAIQAKSASAARDLDKLYEAGDVLYPPCESCHLQYNPGVIQQQ